MFYTISLIVGIILLGVSLFLLKGSLAFLKSSERATATVIEMETVSGTDGNTYKPIFKFKTRHNQEIVFRKSSSSSPPSWKVGEEATIAYDINDPDKARLLTYFGTFIWTIVLMCIALPFIVIGAGYYLSRFVLK